MGKQKYFTEEERKQAQKEANKRWRAKNKEKMKEINKRWRENHPEYEKQRQEKLKNDEDYKARRNASCKRWRAKNPDIVRAFKRRSYERNKDSILERQSEYRSTQKGRANNLASSYRYIDKKQNRGECTITADWIVEHIFNQPCHYCGETDWHELGCDRINNLQPHTPDNCVPCCKACNLKRNLRSYQEFMTLIGKVKGDN